MILVQGIQHTLIVIINRGTVDSLIVTILGWEGRGLGGEERKRLVKLHLIGILATFQVIN